MTLADLNMETIDSNSDGIRDSSVIHLDSQNSDTVLEVTGVLLASRAGSKVKMCQLQTRAAQHAQNTGGKIAAPKIAIID
jgi:hypothetical protein